MEKKRLSSERVFYCLVEISIIILVVMAIRTRGYYPKNPFTDASVYEMVQGWYDQDGNPITLPIDLDVPVNKPVSVTAIIDQKMQKEGYLLFRTDHTFVKADIEGREVYNFGKPQDIKIGKTPGSGWQLISLKSARIGDKITVTFTCPYEKYSGVVRPFLAGEKSELVSYIYWNGISLTLVALIPIFVGLALIVFPILVTSSQQRKKYIQIGVTFLLIGIWGYTESRTWQIISYHANYYWVQMINFMCFSLFTSAGVIAMKNMGYIANQKVYEVLLRLDMGIYVILLLMQLTNWKDYFETLWVVHAMMLSNVVILGTLFFRGKAQESLARKAVGIFFYLLIGIGGVLDLFDFYIWDYFGNGFFTRINFIIILLFCGAQATRRAFVTYGENVEREIYEKMAYTDTLTCLGNHRKYDSDAKKLKEGKNTATIVYADMNGLKPINDHQGHLMGDKALQIVAAALKEELGPYSDLYRMGGDEFCALCYTKNKKEVTELCQEINRKLVAASSEFKTPITISYGVIEYHGLWGDDLVECLNWADQEMYKNKREEYKKRGIARI